MSDEKNHEWIGVSGQRYVYSVLSLPADFKSNELGNYIFAKKGASDNWVPIYMGQGKLKAQISDKHPQVKCMRQKGATHVHVHINSAEWARRLEEHDLLESHLNVFKPYGCNKEEKIQ
jgi:hypothetical protein